MKMGQRGVQIIDSRSDSQIAMDLVDPMKKMDRLLHETMLKFRKCHLTTDKLGRRRVQTTFQWNVN